MYGSFKQKLTVFIYYQASLYMEGNSLTLSLTVPCFNGGPGNPRLEELRLKDRYQILGNL